MLHTPRRTAAEEADVLSDALSRVRLTGAVIFRVEVDGPWCVTAAPRIETFGPALPAGTNEIVAFHVLLNGECWLRCPPDDWVRAHPGDVVVLPHGDVHELGDHRGRSPPALDSLLDGVSLLDTRVLRFDVGEHPHTEVLCGFLGCNRSAFAPLFTALPRMFVTTLDTQANAMVRYAADEALRDEPGAHSLRVRLTELLFLETLREHIRTLPRDATGWLAGLRDPVVGRALRLMHGAPGEEWSVEALAERAACSRSLLAGRFKAVVGSTPMHYLTELRLRNAARRLLDGASSIAAVAYEVGYASPAAFQRAFKRSFGQPPAAWRRAQRG